MPKSKIIALSGILTAFCIILLLMGAFYPTFDLSAMFLCSIVTMIPLSKNSYKGAAFVAIASGLVALLFSGFRFQIILPFLMFFGFHPLVNRIIEQKNLKKWWVFAIKDAWFVLTVVLMQALVGVVMVDVAIIAQFLYPILIIASAIAFFVYDYFINYFQKYMDRIIQRLKL